MSYNTGGSIPGKAGSELPGEDARDCSIDTASTGTHQGPNAGPMTPAGGYGSTGTASSSSPSSKM